MEPLVSICTTTYQHEAYLAKTLDSFLNQKTSFPIEILVHDDCSRDGTPEILRDYAQRYPEIIKPLFEEKNQYSQNVPINETFNFPRARGKYIALCEGDDCWTDERKLQLQADYMEAHPDCTFCFTNGVIEDQSGKRPLRPFLPYDEAQRAYFHDEDFSYGLDEMCGLSFAPTASFFFPRQVLEAMPPCFHEKMCQHGDLKMRLFFTAAGYGRYLNRSTCLYRENVPGSAFQVWTKESAAAVAARAATVVEMLSDAAAFAGLEKPVALEALRNHYLYVQLWNAGEKRPLKNPALRERYKALSLRQKLTFHLKRALPRGLVDGLKKRGLR